ncbi:MAG: YdeI/OmpD-associated family protein [Pseudobdellovibrio sp.]
MNAKVNQFIKKLKIWTKETEAIREILLKTELEEDFKWGLPCYTQGGSNIAILQPFKKCLALMFFKGTLLKDTKKLLIANGPNSQSSKRLEFKSLDDITKNKAVIKAYVKEAIANEKAGKKVEVKKKPASMPVELIHLLDQNTKLKTAFESLTPGRQRAYIMFFSSAKQSETRLARIKKSAPHIIAGKGLNDR